MDWPIPIDDVDLETAAAIVELQREDIEEMKRSTKGKQRQGSVCNDEASLELYLESLSLYEMTLKDHQMARSAATAILNDSALLEDYLRQEDTVRRDHDYAVQLQNSASTGLAPPQGSSRSKNDQPVDDVVRAKLLTRQFADMYGMRIAPWINEDTSIAESSKWAATRKPASMKTSARCVACQEEKAWFDVVTAPCAEDYCIDCLSALFGSSIKDESLYPPRCCGQPIPFEHVRHFFAPEFEQAFDEKRIELDTKDRTYCFAPSCSTFISSGGIADDIATCPRCSRTTCNVCKEQSHQGDCPNDTALQTLIGTANQEGWQRCYSCKRMVELDVGCNHMTCVCRAQFCYVCGDQWKTCACKTWEENQLYNRAVRIQARVANPRRRLYQPPQDEVREAPGLPNGEEIVDHQIQVEQQGEVAQREEAQQREEAERRQARQQEDFGFVPAPIANMPEPPRIGAINNNIRTDTLGRDLRQIMDDLQQNHECEHRHWLYIRGPHRCEECFHTLPQYIFECRQCELQVCWRCRKNRL